MSLISQPFLKRFTNGVARKYLVSQSLIRPIIPFASHHDHAGCNHDCNHEDTVVTRCTKKITDLLAPLKVSVSSSNDDPNGSHIKVEVISAQFEGKNVVQRQRLVYKALWEELNGPVHAVDSIVAKTPKEAGL